MAENIELTYDAGSIYIQEGMGLDTETTVVPLYMAKEACALLATCKDLLAFIKAHDMGGDWCQDNYPTLRRAKEVVHRAENGA